MPETVQQCKPSQLLREKGWGQDHLSDVNEAGERCNFCVYGAFLHCYRRDTRYYAAVNRANPNRVAGDGGPPRILSIRWNDAPGRTAEEVIAALESVGE